MVEETTEPRAGGSATRPGGAKTPTGIHGFDEIVDGGLPRGRSTLVAGPAGSGKTLFGVEFLVRGAQDHGEPGVLMAFEETVAEIAADVASLGFDLPALERSGRLIVDSVRVERSGIVTAGEFDLEGLFIRLASAIDRVGARRVVLDTVDVLFLGFGDLGIVRAELSRLFHWLKDRGMTTVVTAERSRKGHATRFGVEEYVSDCVISLDQRVQDEVSTRRLRVVKYRGSLHGTNEYPFLIGATGLCVVPITSLGLAQGACGERVPSGVEGLDAVIGGGFFAGSSLLVMGGAGTGKTTLAAQLVDATCARGARSAFLSFEESPEQVIRNMRSVGMDLGRWVDQGLLMVGAERAVTLGLEAHLAVLAQIVDGYAPELVVLDGLASLLHVGSARGVCSVVARAIDLLKTRGITAVMTTMAVGNGEGVTPIEASSLADTLLLLGNREIRGVRNRELRIIKSRGTAHSNRAHEFLITSRGPCVVELPAGGDGAPTGTAREASRARDDVEAGHQAWRRQRQRELLARRVAQTEAEIAGLRARLEAERIQLELLASAGGTRSAESLAEHAAGQVPATAPECSEETS